MIYTQSMNATETVLVARVEDWVKLITTPGVLYQRWGIAIEAALQVADGPVVRVRLSPEHAEAVLEVARR